MSFSEWDYTAKVKARRVSEYDEKYGGITYSEPETLLCSWETNVDNQAFTGFNGEEFIASHIVYTNIPLDYRDQIKIDDRVNWKTIYAITTWTDQTFSEDFEYRYLLK